MKFEKWIELAHLFEQTFKVKNVKRKVLYFAWNLTCWYLLVGFLTNVEYSFAMLFLHTKIFLYKIGGVLLPNQILGCF